MKDLQNLPKNDVKISSHQKVESHDNSPYYNRLNPVPKLNQQAFPPEALQSSLRVQQLNHSQFKKGAETERLEGEQMLKVKELIQ
mmetsp:Transcript_8220/g.12599  ORF Transcript_8220/g.12599 Transcript_8220/m.12599 type:complete len:85 (-) Transcript_8220:42-296(-)